MNHGRSLSTCGGPTGGNERERFLDEFVRQVAASIAEEQGLLARCVSEDLGDALLEKATVYEALQRMDAAERAI